jgi:hypothetical protein
MLGLGEKQNLGRKGQHKRPLGAGWVNTAKRQTKLLGWRLWPIAGHVSRPDCVAYSAKKASAIGVELLMQVFRKRFSGNYQKKKSEKIFRVFSPDYPKAFFTQNT